MIPTLSVTRTRVSERFKSADTKCQTCLSSAARTTISFSATPWKHTSWYARSATCCVRNFQKGNLQAYVTARESFKYILLGTFYLVPSRFYH